MTEDFPPLLGSCFLWEAKINGFNSAFISVTLRNKHAERLREVSELVDMSSSAVSSSSSSFSVLSGSSASGSGSTHRPGMREAESYELHSGPTMCVMKDSCSLANWGAARSMKGLMGRPRLDSSSPYQNTHKAHISLNSSPKRSRKRSVHIIVSHNQRGKTDKRAYSVLASGDLRGHSMWALYDVCERCE